MLWRCLEKKRASLKITRFFRNCYGLTKNFAQFNRGNSNIYELQKGGGQGDPCSGPLFNIYLNRLVDAVRTGKSITIKIGGTFIFVTLYAADVVLIADSEQQLQELLNSAMEFSTERKLTVNVTKSKAMVIKGNRCKRFEVKTYIGAVAL